MNLVLFGYVNLVDNLCFSEFSFEHLNNVENYNSFFNSVRTEMEPKECIVVVLFSIIW